MQKSIVHIHVISYDFNFSAIFWYIKGIVSRYKALVQKFNLSGYWKYGHAQYHGIVCVQCKDVLRVKKSTVFRHRQVLEKFASAHKIHAPPPIVHLLCGRVLVQDTMPDKNLSLILP
jgi:hypothetical protein